MIFEQLSSQEKYNITRYIEEYGFKTERIAPPKPLEHILRLWDSAKSEYLFNLFGGKNLIIHRPIEIKKSDDELYEECKEKLWAHPFYITVTRLMQLGQPLYNQTNLFNLLNFSSLTTNIYDGYSFLLPLPNGKSYRVEKGVKVMRALGKIAKAYNIPHFEDFCIVHSQMLNQKTVIGKLYLSIHPLDYLTMSDNASNWTSCMNWKNIGEYRMGTVEMMNSPCVVVAYVTNERDPYYLFNDADARWFNKKWRELFIVDKSVITGIKGYPYTSRELERETVNWLRELAAKNLGWEYDDKYYSYYEDSTVNELPISLGKTIIVFTTNVMYNDFNNGNQHRGYFNLDELKSHLDEFGQFFLNYSGPAECMNCGNQLDSSAAPEPDMVICYRCEKGHGFECSYCGTVYTNEEYGHWLNSTEWICENCYSQYYFCCDNCFTDVYEIDVEEVYIIFDNNAFAPNKALRFCPECYEYFKNQNYIKKFKFHGLFYKGIDYNTLINVPELGKFLYQTGARETSLSDLKEIELLA